MTLTITIQINEDTREIIQKLAEVINEIPPDHIDMTYEREVYADNIIDLISIGERL